MKIGAAAKGNAVLVVQTLMKGKNCGLATYPDYKTEYGLITIRESPLLLIVIGTSIVNYI